MMIYEMFLNTGFMTILLANQTLGHLLMIFFGTKLVYIHVRIIVGFFNLTSFFNLINVFNKQTIVVGLSILNICIFEYVTLDKVQDFILIDSTFGFAILTFAVFQVQFEIAFQFFKSFTCLFEILQLFNAKNISS